MKRVEVARGAAMTSDICEYISLLHLEYPDRSGVYRQYIFSVSAV